jgi:NADH dehydrogenase
MVEGVDASGVVFRDAQGVVERYDAKTVLWAGGVTTAGFGRTLSDRTGAPTDKHGHILVNPDLTIPSYPEIFVVGDLASVKGPNGKPLPGIAQVAMQGGAYAARAIRERLRGPDGHNEALPFHYFDKGDLAVIGRGAAVANIFGLRLSGLPAWLVWLFIHLMYLVQFQNRVVVFIQWGFQYLTFGRRARLITGVLPTDTIGGGGITGKARE